METRIVVVPWCTVVAGQIDVSTGGEGGDPDEKAKPLNDRGLPKPRKEYRCASTRPTRASPSCSRLVRNRPLANSAIASGEARPSIRASRMALPDTPSMFVSTLLSLMLALSSAF